MYQSDKCLAWQAICKGDDCTGCFACVNVCHQGAIVASTDNKGFYRPQILEDECVNCGLCSNVCPVLSPIHNVGFHQEAYVCKNKSDEIRRKSSSGGLFSALADAILAKGGIVFGVKIDNSIVTVFSSSDSENGIESFRGSKYVQAYVGDVYREIKKSLISGRSVLFTGTPCQVAGLKSYLSKDYSNLYTLDFLCHGVPSPKTFLKNIEEIEQKEQDKVVSYHFRDKQKSWHLFNTRICFTSGRVKTVFSRFFDYYYRLFLSSYGLQNSCYNCLYTKRERMSDITMADCWMKCSKTSKLKIHYDDKGLSLAIINSHRGADLFREISSSVTSSSLNYDEVVDKNVYLRKPSCKPKDNELFWSEMMKGSSIQDIADLLLPSSKISFAERLIMKYGSNPFIRLISKFEYRYNKYCIPKK